jgi:phage terminase large subunit-like protein
VFAAPKKSGKTTFAALHALVTTWLFGGSYPEVTLVANDYEQARGRVFEMVRRFVECSPLLKREAYITTDRIEFHAIKATIRAIAADYAGAAGGNQNLSVFDELWAYTSERSRRLWDELIPPPTRKIAARLTVTYAGFASESQLLEELYKRGLQQPSIGDDLYAGDGLLMFWSHQPIAPWQTDQWLTEMRRSLRPNQYLRMIENRFVTSESTFIALADWDACVVSELTPILKKPSLSVCIGVDASVKHDSTAIVVVHWDNANARGRLVTHRIFQPSPSEPLDFEAAIESTLLDLNTRFRVIKVLYDPYQMMAVAQRLSRAGVPMEEYPQTVPNLTQASQNLYELIRARSLMVYPDAAIRLAISRAVAVETARGWRIVKEKQAHKIDVVVALAMACHAAAQCEYGDYDVSMRWVDGGSDTDQEAEWKQFRANQYWSRFPIQ